MTRVPSGLAASIVSFLRGATAEEGPDVGDLAEDLAVEDLVFGTVHGRAEAVAWWRSALEELPHAMTIERVDVYESAIAVATVVRGVVDGSRFVAPRLTVATVVSGRVVAMRNAWNDPRHAAAATEEMASDAG